MLSKKDSDFWLSNRLRCTVLQFLPALWNQIIPSGSTEQRTHPRETIGQLAHSHLLMTALVCRCVILYSRPVEVWPHPVPIMARERIRETINSRAHVCLCVRVCCLWGFQSARRNFTVVCWGFFFPAILLVDRHGREKLFQPPFCFHSHFHSVSVLSMWAASFTSWPRVSISLSPQSPLSTRAASSSY